MMDINQLSMWSQFRVYVGTREIHISIL